MLLSTDLQNLAMSTAKTALSTLSRLTTSQTAVQQILDQFKADGDDIIIAITTPCGQLAAPYSEEIPESILPQQQTLSVQVSATRLKAQGQTSQAHLTSSLSQRYLTLRASKTRSLKIKTLGYLYNTGEDNSVSTLKEVKAYCEEKGIAVIEGAASNTHLRCRKLLQNLAAKCDAVFSPNDNTIAGAMGTVTEVMNKAKVPMFVGADSMVMDGGLGTVGIEYSDLGKETANMAAQILSGEKKASEIPIKVFNEDLSTYINKTTADTIGITIPDDIANGEKTVYFD